jgi:hypothetical protein
LEKAHKILKIIAILGNPIKFKHLNRELAWKCPSVDLFRLKKIRRIICRKKFPKKFCGKKIRENILKKSAEKNPLNLGKKSQNPEKNCRDFLTPKIFVRFFQSNLPLASACTFQSHDKM